MRTNYFINAEQAEKSNLSFNELQSRADVSHSGGFLQNVISFITDNKDLLGSTAKFASSAYSAGKSIHDAAKNPEEEYKKSDKEIIEDMKVERVYKDLQDLKKLRKLKVERVYNELSKIKKVKDLKLYRFLAET
jgi:hypothetical protein